MPEAIVEVVDPMILGSRVQEVCNCNCCPPSPPVIPEAILGCFEEQLVLDGESKRLLVTIGQFSIARLERSTQLLIPTFDYCIPSKTCKNVGSSNTESPCEVFGQIEFPMDAFFPSKARFLHPRQGQLHKLREDRHVSKKAPLFVEGGRSPKAIREEKFFHTPPGLALLGQPPLGRGGLLFLSFRAQKIPCSASTAHISSTRASHELLRPSSMRSAVRSGCVSQSAASHAAANPAASSAMWMSGAYCRI